MAYHAFSDIEGVRIAVEMERRGESFYRTAARLAKTSEARDMLNSLADEEAAHLREFQRLCDCLAGNAACESLYTAEQSAYLSAIAADIVFPEGLMTLRRAGFDDPKEVLQAAIDSEKDSILFYTELAALTTDPMAREVFGEIIRQERKHMTRLLTRLSEA